MDPIYIIKQWRSSLAYRDAKKVGHRAFRASKSSF